MLRTAVITVWEVNQRPSRLFKKADAKPLFMVLKKLLIKLKCSRGAADLVTLTFVSWLTIMLAVAGIDIFFMASRFMTVNNIAQKTLDAMKYEGYYSEAIHDGFNSLLELHGLKLGRDVFLGERTLEPKQRGEVVQLTVRAVYPLQGFRPIGYTFEVPWVVRKTGVSYQFGRGD